MSTILLLLAGAVMGVVLAVVGVYAWQWQFWAVMGCAFLYYLAGLAARSQK